MVSCEFVNDYYILLAMDINIFGLNHGKLLKLAKFEAWLAVGLLYFSTNSLQYEFCVKGNENMIT